VTSTPVQEALPEWSPDGKALTFFDFTAQGGIWIARRQADDSWSAPVRRLDHGVVPTFSSDGRMLAFSTTIDGYGALGVVPVDSGPARILVDPAQGGPASSGAYWSRDDRTIYFKGIDREGVASFWAVSPAGGTPRLIARLADPLRPSYRPNWALGRTRIYFTIYERQSDVWVMDTGGL
jgi:Tol biopolymer transport system component